MNRRTFFGALAGSAALATLPVSAAEPTVPGWVITWCGWREPWNQTVRVGWWMGRRDPMPETFGIDEYPLWYATTVGGVGGMFDGYVVDTSRYDRTAPFRITDDPAAFEAAKLTARQHLVETLRTR